MPNNIQFTEDQKAFIAANWRTMSYADIDKHIGRTKGTTLRYLRRNGMQLPIAEIAKKRARKMTGRTSFTKEQDDYIKANYLKKTYSQLATDLEKSDTGIKCALKRLGLKVPEEEIKRRRDLTQYRKGSVPANKGKKMSPKVYERLKRTFFKKGHLPTNAKPVGYEAVRSDKRTGAKYIMIKVEGKRKMVYKHRWLWEQHHGKIPKGHNIVHRDGNTLNCTIENLECISDEENALRNSKHNIPREVIPTMLLINQIKKVTNEKQNDRP